LRWISGARPPGADAASSGNRVTVSWEWFDFEAMRGRVQGKIGFKGCFMYGNEKV
jgi:hypothetical protein